MATRSVLMYPNFPGNCFMVQRPTVPYFHPFFPQKLLSKPINVLGQDLFRFYQTHQVDARAVADGDTITVYVNVLEDPTQLSLVPPFLLEAHFRRNEAKAMRNYAEADSLQQMINDHGFRVIKFDNNEVLVRKYRIRLRGIDAPESEMPYGKEATEELIKIVEGKCLRVLVYEIDSYGRLVGDIYCDDNIFVQWESEAKVNQIGLWASSDPEEPWEWRKNQRKMAMESIIPRHHNCKKKCAT